MRQNFHPVIGGHGTNIQQGTEPAHMLHVGPTVPRQLFEFLNPEEKLAGSYFVGISFSSSTSFLISSVSPLMYLAAASPFMGLGTKPPSVSLS